MNEDRMRKLEKAASQGDEEAAETLRAMRVRVTGGRHADKIGHWVCIDGVRDHYRGRLLGVTEVGGGIAMLHLAPCYWLYSLQSTQEERATTATEAHPSDLSSMVVGAVSLQPQDWPKS